MKIKIVASICITVLCFFITVVQAKDYHVAKSGSDANTGTIQAPFLTINRAAVMAQEGDNIIVHSGTYREWVNPSRGGDADGKRITYMAAPGKEVIIKGSEQINVWQNLGNGVWKAELDNSFFNDYNPFALNVKAAWMRYGEWHTRGAVYLNEVAFSEKATLQSVKDSINSWHTEVSGQKTQIWANFGASDPNKELTEINVRETLFFPESPRLNYITVNGFTMKHAAVNWSPPGTLQKGAIGPNFGFNWIIENCTITDSRAIGISIGHHPDYVTRSEYADLETTGHHIIRNNVIKRCGQSGIAGHNGCMASEVYGNTIEDTNYLKEFGGWETAALKFHHGIDMHIHNNFIRGVYKGGEGGALGIWIDVGTQGMRISRNVIICDSDHGLYFEANHGPILVDNNILIGGGVQQRGEAGIFVHNLFIDCQPLFTYENFENDAKVLTGARNIPIFEPHTSREVSRLPISLRNDRWYNNLFLKSGLNKVPEAEGFRIDYNVYLDGALTSEWADKNSFSKNFDSKYKLIQGDDSFEISMNIPKKIFQLKYPTIDFDFIGKLPYTNQRIETRSGEPINIDNDFYGERFTNTIAGPFSSLKPGDNHLVLWKFNK